MILDVNPLGNGHITLFLRRSSSVRSGPISIPKKGGVRLGVRAVRGPLFSRDPSFIFTLPSTSESSTLLRCCFVERCGGLMISRLSESSWSVVYDVFSCRLPWIKCTKGIHGQVSVDILDQYLNIFDQPLLNSPSIPQLSLNQDSTNISVDSWLTVY